MREEVVRFICLLATARSGSTYLMKLLEQSPAIGVCGEVFNPNPPALRDDEMDALRRAAGVHDPDDPLLLRWRHDNPIRCLDALHECAGTRFLLFKLFVNHLEYETIRTRLFPRDDIRFVVLRRRPAECYVSLAKARMLKSFGYVDTTAMRPRVPPAQFFSWMGKARRWYRFVDAHLERLPHPHANMTYETDIEGRAPEETLKRATAALDKIGIALPVPAVSAPLEKQDREPSVENRIANWDEIERLARSSPRHRSLYRWAMTVPGRQTAADTTMPS